MTHCYILDYSTSKIYHVKVPWVEWTSSDFIETWIHTNLGLNIDEISYMLVDNELSIEEL